MTSDRRLLYVTAALRSFGVGLLGVLLAFHLARKGFGPAEVGHLVAAGLAGAAVGTALVGAFADRWGRRRTLIALALLSAAGGIAATSVASLPVAVVAAFFGMLNGAGRERGPVPALEQAVLASTTTDADRTRAFAVYNLVDDASLALGALVVFLAKIAPGASGLPEEVVARGGVAASLGLFVPTAVAYALLSRRVESVAPRAAVRLSPTTKSRLSKICALFAIDAFGGGLLASTFLALYFQERFGARESTVALLFFGARVLNAVSHLGAAWLSRRIGLVNTMVFTHIPSSVLLFTVTIAPSFEVAAVLFLLREGLVEMDVPTRQSYVMAIVLPHERTAASAAASLVRIGAWAVAAEVAGRLMEDVSISVPLAIAAALKIAYDLMLWSAFRRVRPPEERG